MKTNVSGDGVKVAKQYAKSSITSITAARKTANRSLCERAGLKQNELAELILSESNKLAEKELKARQREQLKYEMKRLGVRTKAEYQAILQEQEELTEYLRRNFPYREASGRWNQPENSIEVIISKDMIRGICHVERTYSRNGKWGGNESHYRFHIPKNHAAKVIGGLFTVYKKTDEHATVKRCTWWEQGAGLSIKQVEGWLVAGYHSQAGTKEQAVRSAKAARTRATAKDEQVITPDYANRRWGFCFAGIRQFMELNGIDSESITMKELRAVVVRNRELNYKLYSTHLKRMGLTLNY